MYGELEQGLCDVCGKNETLERTYFNYPIKCKCHSPKHFEMRRHGKDCLPKEPGYTNVQFSTEDLKNPVCIALPILVYALNEDKDPGSYYHTWQSNIACAIMDTMPNVENIHELANEAAKRFLENLIR